MAKKRHRKNQRKVVERRDAVRAIARHDAPSPLRQIQQRLQKGVVPDWARSQLTRDPVRVRERVAAQPAARLSSAPVPVQHAAPAIQPGTPIKKADKKTIPQKKPVNEPSLSARDTRKCKERPDRLEPRKSGGGQSKRFVPWCDVRR